MAFDSRCTFVELGIGLLRQNKNILEKWVQLTASKFEAHFYLIHFSYAYACTYPLMFIFILIKY